MPIILTCIAEIIFVPVKNFFDFLLLAINIFHVKEKICWLLELFPEMLIMKYRLDQFFKFQKKKTSAKLWLPTYYSLETRSEYLFFTFLKNNELLYFN